MVGTSKVLTVSYGTFSCTLEGFDDAFETMKAIAEYFRDLAANDRFFGAEPPTPDPEMLARIAEREIARRVDAHQNNGQIVLRAAESDLAAPMPTPEPAAEPVVASDGAAEPDTAPRAVGTTSPERTPGPPAAQTVAEDAVAEEAVAEEAEVVTTDKTAPAGKTVADAEAAEAEPQATKTRTPAAQAIMPEQAAPEPAAASQPLAESVVAEPVEAEPVEVEDSVAARLRRIRSVVAQSPVSQGDDYIEDEHAQDFLSRTAAELDAALSAEDETASEADDALAGLAERLQEEAAAERDARGESSAHHAATEQKTRRPDATDAREGTDATAEEPDQEALLAQILADASPVEQSDTPPPVEEPLLAQEQETEAEIEATSKPPMRAHAVKMKRSEFEAAIAAGEFEEEEDGAKGDFDLTAEIDKEDEFEDEDEAILSPEDEAELLRELAAVEAELQRDARPETAPEQRHAPTPAPAPASGARPAATTPGRERLQSAQPEPEAERIFEEADTRFEAPDTSQRRKTIQHLRAAVAATRAEQSAGGQLARETDDTAYRSDLAKVMRPRRPQAPAGEGARTARRPVEERLAPLKLVAEQRVDTPRPTVRPRRISAAPTTGEAETGASDTGQHGSFSDFARKIGATTLAELLEAAAAYMADVEGREQFSRPMLMGKLKEAAREEFSREDGLRSFGYLLRQGKLQKLKGGRFTVTEQTEFRAEARRVG